MQQLETSHHLQTVGRLQIQAKRCNIKAKDHDICIESWSTLGQLGQFVSYEHFDNNVNTSFHSGYCIKMPVG